jgi:hypothetical protein
VSLANVYSREIRSALRILDPTQCVWCVCFFVFISSTMRFSRHGLGASTPLITTVGSVVSWELRDDLTPGILEVWGVQHDGGDGGDGATDADAEVTARGRRETLCRARIDNAGDQVLDMPK